MPGAVASYQTINVGAVGIPILGPGRNLPLLERSGVVDLSRGGKAEMDNIVRDTISSTLRPGDQEANKTIHSDKLKKKIFRAIRKKESELNQIPVVALVLFGTAATNQSATKNIPLGYCHVIRGWSVQGPLCSGLVSRSLNRTLNGFVIVWILRMPM